MPYGTPTDPVTDTVITTAYAILNLLNPIRWLRTMTGGADPPNAGYMVTSDSASTTTWKTGVAAILSVLGYTPANAAGQAFSGAVSTSGGATITWGDSNRRTDTAPADLDNITASGWYMAVSGTTHTPTVARYLVNHIQDSVGGFSYQFAYHTTDGTQNAFRFNGGSGYSAWFKMWNALNDGAGSGLAADTADTATLAANSTLVGGKAPGTTANTIAFYDAAFGQVEDSAKLGGLAASSYGRVNSASVANNSSGLGLTVTQTNVPGCSISAPTTGTYLVIASAYGFAQVAAGSTFINIAVAGTLVGSVRKINQAQFGTTPDASAFGGGTIFYVGSITAAQSVTLQAGSAVAASSSIDEAQITLIRIA